jgi:hypothetical protein
MAFVLLGAAYQDSNKSEAAKYLKSALESSGEITLISFASLKFHHQIHL